MYKRQATKFSTAADKAEFGNTLLRFIESEWVPALFTKSFYNRLSMCFGHIAHYNRTQFYEEWFSSLAAQVRFLKHTLRFPCYGDPEYTFSDVERAIQREIGKRNYLVRYELRRVEAVSYTHLDVYKRQESDNACSRAIKKTVRVLRKPGASPMLFGKFLMTTTAFLSLEDISDNLPRYDESVISVDMDDVLQQAYEQLEDCLLYTSRCV